MFYLRLMGVFFKIGLLTIGGGYAMLPLIQREIIDRGWLTAREFVHIITIAEMTPGPIAINAATFVGYRLAGVKGSVLTTTAISLPSLLIILAVSKFLTHFEDHPTVQKVFYGLRLGSGRTGELRGDFHLPGGSLWLPQPDGRGGFGSAALLGPSPSSASSLCAN